MPCLVGKNRGFEVCLSNKYKFLYFCRLLLSKNLKKILTIFILIIFLFNSVGYYLLFEWNKQIIKIEVQKNIQEQTSRLTVLKINDVENNKEFQRVDRKEFRYKGALYDILREIKTGKTTLFICFHDKKETALFAGLKRVNQNKVHFIPLEQMNLLFFIQKHNDFKALLTGQLLFPRIHVLLKSSMLPTWSPPPEIS